MERAVVRQFAEFLRDEYGTTERRDRVQSMLAAGERRLMVSVDEIRAADESLARSLIASPLEYLAALNQALRDEIKMLAPDKAEDEDALNRFYVGVHGSLGDHRVTPRELLSEVLGSMVEVEGIVTRASLVRPKLVRSVHYSKVKNMLVTREYRDGAAAESMDAVFGAPSAYMTKDEEGNVLETEYGMSSYLDNQRIVLQEMPEKSPPGQLPRSIDVIVEDDLVDTCKPGDRVRVVGIFRALGGVRTAQTSGIFKTVVIANSVRQIREESTGHLQITEGDMRNIRQVAQRKDLNRLLSGSVAPSICGHDYIKKAILLMLLGGNEKNMANGTHLRGDINILMIGDPSTAKSQLLRFVMHLAPLAVSTTGRGSSGVGLTAAVTHDPDTSEKHLEAGAMVLADRGVVCIDEFDKMSEEDRVAIHEVMEQQTVTIAKAGIHASLNARCSVIAAANPIYGSFDTKKTTYENSALPDSLLSRFDLIFTVLDLLDEEVDFKIAEHVLRAHQYRRGGQDQDVLMEVDDEAMREGERDARQEDGTSVIFDRNSKKLYSVQGKKAKKVLSSDFLRKYIYFAKTKFRPVLTEAAGEYIASKYRDLRSTFLSSNVKTLPITPRCLETLIRLATAVAKSRLSLEVTESDAQEAFSILNFALTHQRANSNSRKRPRREGGPRDEPRDTAEPRVSGTAERTRTRHSQQHQQSTSRGAGAQPGQGASDAVEGTPQSARAAQEASQVESTQPLADSAGSQGGTDTANGQEAFRAPSPPAAPPVSDDVLKIALGAVHSLTRESSMCTLVEVRAAVGDQLSTSQLDRALDQLVEDEKIFLHEGKLFRV